jgi:hypothetical protein
VARKKSRPNSRKKRRERALKEAARRLPVPVPSYPLPVLWELKDDRRTIPR